jgi:hypothetical protein
MYRQHVVCVDQYDAQHSVLRRKPVTSLTPSDAYRASRCLSCSTAYSPTLMNRSRTGRWAILLYKDILSRYEPFLLHDETPRVGERMMGDGDADTAVLVARPPIADRLTARCLTAGCPGQPAGPLGSELHCNSATAGDRCRTPGVA